VSAFFLAGVIFLTVLLTIFQTHVLFSTNETVEHSILKEEKRISECRKKVFNYIISHSLPYTFDVPVEQVCGRYFYAEKKDCDDYFCTYAVSFGKFKETAKPAFRITKKQLSSYAEGENVEKLLALAKALRDYQNSFPDSSINNHWVSGIGDTSGYKSVENYSSFFEELKADWKDLYYDKLGYSSFYICTTSGSDCTIDGIECELKYISPYTGEVKEITIRP